MKKIKSVFLALTLVFIASVLCACDQSKEQAEKGGKEAKSAQQGQAQEGKSTPQGGQRKISVGVIELSPVSVELTQDLPARIVSYQVAEIRPQVSGIIQSRMFDEGTFVEEGQQLYQIDPDTYEANFQMAKANLERAKAASENAQRQAGRLRELLKTNAISQQEVDNAEDTLAQAKAGVSVAEAELTAAEVQLEYTKVYAPISGYISTSNVTKGALVTALQATPLATVRQLDPVYVDISQSVAATQNLQARLMQSRLQGKSPSFSVSLLIGSDDQVYPQKGRLKATELEVDRQTGAIKLRAVFANPDAVLLPGMFVRAVIQDVGRSEALTVPQKSVSINPDGSKHVWVAGEDDTAHKRAIQTSTTYQNRWVVTRGLEEGDRVIVEGTMNLREGTPLDLEIVDVKSMKSAKDKNIESSGNKLKFKDKNLEAVYVDGNET